MFFKNLTLFQFTESFALSAAALAEALEEHTLRPCPSAMPSFQGWLPAYEGGSLAEGHDRHLFARWGISERLLPAAAVNQALRRKVDDYSHNHGYKPGRKQRMEMRDSLMAEMLPKAFLVEKSARIWIDAERALLIVDSGSAGQAEKAVELLREHVPDLPRIILPDTSVGMQTLLSEWLGRGEAPGDFSLDDEATLQGTDTSGSKIAYSRIPVGSAQELRRHLDSGKRATKLGLTWRDQLSITLTDTLQVKRLKLLDTQTDDESREDDPHLAFEADMRLMVGVLGPMLDELGAHVGMRKGGGQ